MSQFKKAMLKKYLSLKKKRRGSAQNEPENPVSDVPLLEEESPSSPMSTNSLVLIGKIGFYPLIAKIWTRSSLIQE